jgi:glyoxalase family protein
MRLGALHHVTAICSSAQATADFYRGLGLHLVKKTVNFDDPASYHLYFGDEAGAPGTLLTFFEWPGARRGRAGAGSVVSIELAAPGVDEPRTVADPDGLRLELVPGERPELRALAAFGDAHADLLAEGAPLEVRAGAREHAALGAGVVHHHAWRVPDAETQLAWRERLLELGLHPSEVLDRKYFRSVYFRTPDGLLFELATDGPGFAVDEPADSLGRSLALPPWLEPERDEIERTLAPVA